MTLPDYMDPEPRKVRSHPQVVDDLSQQHPDDVWMTIPLDSDLSGRWCNITYKDLSRAVSGMLSWMKEALGDYKRSSGVVAYIG